MTAHERNKECCVRKAATLSPVAISFLFLTLLGPAAAQTERDADFQAYCRTKHPGSTHQRIGLMHFCQQSRGGAHGATLQDIDLAEVCRMTTGNRTFRKSGSRILCAARSDSPATASSQNAPSADAGPPDFRAYCQEKFPNSSYEKRAERWGVVHYCRRPGTTGGFTLQAINLAEACEASFGSRKFRRDGPSVTCLKGGPKGSDVAQQPHDDKDEPPTRKEPVPPQPPQPNKPPQPPEPETVQDDSRGREFVKNRCQFLGGEWRSGTIPLVEDILSQWEKVMAQRISQNCSRGPKPEYCRRQIVLEETHNAYIKTHMVWQCHVFLVREPHDRDVKDIRTARQEGCQLQETVLELWEKDFQAAKALEELGGTFVGGRPATRIRDPKLLLENLGVDDLCAKGVIRFVRRDGTEFPDEENLPLMEPIYTEIEFDRAMKKPSRTIRLMIEGGSIELEAYQQEPKLYRTEDPIILEPRERRTGTARQGNASATGEVK